MSSFHEGHTYNYFYYGRIATGIPELGTQMSGSGLRANMHLKINSGFTADVQVIMLYLI